MLLGVRVPFLSLSLTITLTHTNKQPNMTLAGFIGSLTGYSSAPVGICEKVWLGYNGTSSRRGIPWNFLLRDILQFDADINAAVSRMAGTYPPTSLVPLSRYHGYSFYCV